MRYLPPERIIGRWWSHPLSMPLAPASVGGRGRPRLPIGRCSGMRPWTCAPRAHAVNHVPCWLSTTERPEASGRVSVSPSAPATGSGSLPAGPSEPASRNPSEARNRWRMGDGCRWFWRPLLAVWIIYGRKGRKRAQKVDTWSYGRKHAETHNPCSRHMQNT